MKIASRCKSPVGRRSGRRNPRRRERKNSKRQLPNFNSALAALKKKNEGMIKVGEPLGGFDKTPCR